MVIVDYSPDWPPRFEAERRRIQAALGPVARRVEHVGSTAVPGLAAKPVIDILVTVAQPEDEQVYRPALQATGYLLRVREPGHRMFRTPAKDVHVHVWPVACAEERKLLAFRDALRSNADDRAEYERTKRHLAGRWRDMNYYARAKGPVIERILERADQARTGQRASTTAGDDGSRGSDTSAGRRADSTGSEPDERPREVVFLYL